MTLAWLLLMHFVGDYLFQTQAEALGKAEGKWWNSAILAHCATYTACFIPVFLFYHIHPIGIVAIFFSHWFLDRRWPVIWWREHVTRNSRESIQATFWLTIVLDQVFHITVLFAIAAVHLGAR
jgi:hypothetical protein